ncbi:hypothetical protein A6A06_16325 [Streptomyces sp. CB02923]|uniref:MFS transporter n=1 Tax=Streptomyces sp. CB02923 TaxID=1718985 RepID=UPI000939D802|nr:MFS transporter [Streptomyces sp. CB02923]OKI02578.1 hypothetical protein A6A06_16325 [Streptomyces sp. CB02923]
MSVLSNVLSNTVAAVRRLGPGNRVLFLATFILQGGSVVLPFLTAYLVNQDRYAIGTVGLIVACYSVGGLLADLCSGPLLRALTASTLMKAGLAGNAVMVMALPYVHAPVALAAVVLAWGFCYEVFMPASYGETVRLSPEGDLKIAFSFNRLAFNLGMGAGPVVGAFLFGRWPAVLFVVNALAAVAVGLCLASRWGSRALRQPTAGRDLPTPPETATPSGTATSSETAEETTAAPNPRHSGRRFWTLLLLSLPIHYAYGLPLIFLSVYIPHYLHLPTMWVGLVFAVNAGTVVLFEIPLNTMMRNVGSLPTLIIGYVLAAGGFALMGVAQTGPALVLTTLLWTAAEMMVFPGLIHYVSVLSPPAATSRNMGLYAAVMNVGLMAASQLALVVASYAGPSIPWYSAGAAIGVAAVVFHFLRRSDRRRHRESGGVVGEFVRG